VPGQPVFGLGDQQVEAWLSDDSVTKTDLIEAAVACAPVWWS